VRLKTIKLSGFKSFVDPTVFHLPSNLIGVVGPNGCGKSNIIDAIRWVMGESSARMLRGELMTDVIFNGSNVRKPVGTATVELIFDNSDGSLGGEYASYAEISTKRQVSREGQSLYFLNGHRCRRRDITDIFLGTGLGPRSYSIIEQGMISQIVDSKPEDIRLHLEEAAGISKYKERRRETENRIRHTRENLERLDDLRSEVDKQLQHLKRQARQAERYKDLKSKYRRLEAELLALQWQELEADLTKRKLKLGKLETGLESEVADQRALEAQIEQTRGEQTTANEKVAAVQAELYEVGGDIARIEQAIQHRKDLSSRQQQEQREAEKNWQELEEHLALDRVQIEEHRTAIADLEPRLEAARSVENQTGDDAQKADEKELAGQQEWDEFSRVSGEKTQSVEVERTRIGHLDQQLNEQAERLQGLAKEQQGNDTAEIEKELAVLLADQKRLEKQGEELQQQLETLRQHIQTESQSNRDQAADLNGLREDYQQRQGRLSSLEALQQAALGDDRPEIQEWLDSQGVSKTTHLAQGLKVADGWELAVEIALGDFVEALVVDDPLSLSASASTLEKGRVVLAAAGGKSSEKRVERLAAKVQGAAMIDGLLAGVMVAEDLDAALSLVSTLAPGESVMTRSGEWLGPGWVRIGRGEDAGGGVISREREIKSLRDELQSLSSRGEQASAALAEGEKRLADLERDREEQQTQLNMLHRRLAEVAGQAHSKQARIEHFKSREEQLNSESEQLRERIANDENSVRQARGRLQQSMDQLVDLKDQREQLESLRKERIEAREQVRQQAREAREHAHKLEVELQSRRASLRSTEQAVDRMTSQMQHLDQRRRQLLEQVEQADQPMQEDEKQLKQLLGQRLKVDERLAEARKQMDQINLVLRELEHRRGLVSDGIQQARSQLEDARVDLQGRSVKAETVVEQIAKTEFEIDQLIEEMPEGAEIESWQASQERLEKRITRLEPVNLAAIQEFDEQDERKTYLDAQNEDLIKALETLEAAISKIDRQTRTRFKETFDRVNLGIQELFPRLFGGGHGYMELTGEDLLLAGVQIMARPPGKRVTNIHLLSGGEKALTAVAFVFAIFRLNPAPFCLLDEVDAPLDDANVARFSELVLEMAEKVQFLFVTHNKITMEMAHQLTGVTMREPGVSRMVSVDMAEAERMAAE
jgi:chromosome segregation protein